MTSHRFRPATALAAASIAALLLAGCANSADDSNSSETESPSQTETATAPGHGAVAGAAEAPEPPLHLITIDGSGNAALLDLLDGTETALDRVRPPATVTTDGRYAFVADDSGVDIIDSGAWTWDHVDHFHYYRADPAAPGSVAGTGVATVSTGMLATAGGTGLFFPESGEAVLLDNAALAAGEISETLRLDVGAHQGLIAPLGNGALVTAADADNAHAPASALRAVDADGNELDTITCPAASGSITTRIALVVGCADGAVLATADTTGAVTLEKVAYPEGAAAPATEFSARKGRPTVAGLGTDAGVWLLDTRAHAWSWVATPERPIAATAVDDEAEHIVTVTPAGSVTVIDATGAQLGTTEPLISAIADLTGDAASGDAAGSAISLTADAQRAYLNDPETGAVFEIDYVDGARVARTLTTEVAAAFVVETGR